MLPIFLNDDGKASAPELDALIAVAKNGKNSFDVDTKGVLLDLYKLGESSFENTNVRTQLRSVLRTAGQASPAELGEDASDVASFETLSDTAKMTLLFPFPGTFAKVSPDFLQVDTLFKDVLKGSALRRANEVYRSARTQSLENGGNGLVSVTALQRNGETYAYALLTSGRTVGNWANLAVFDRNFERIGGNSYAD